MAERQFTLTEAEILEFKHLEDTLKQARDLKRVQAVRLYGMGYAVAAIHELTGCSWRALMDWCRAYRQGGLARLQSQWQGENALKLSREQRAAIKARLRQYRPDQVLAAEVRVAQGEFWTVSDLKIVVEQWYGVRYQSVTSYHRLLHECRFSQQQTAPRYRSRPNDLAVMDFEAALEKK